MQEYQITAGGARHRLAEPFFVLATQNPIEHEGTYPLPEAQLDRFMFHIRVDYPSEEEEFQIVRQTTADVETQISATLSGEQILALQKIVRRVPVADHVIRYALDLVRRTRADGPPTRPTSSAPTCNGAPARGRASTWSSAPRPGPCCKAAASPAARTCRRLPAPCCGTASSRTSTPRPKGSSRMKLCGG